MSSRYAAHSPASARSAGGALFQKAHDLRRGEHGEDVGAVSAAVSGRMVSLRVTSGNGMRPDAIRGRAPQTALRRRAPAAAAASSYSALRRSTTRTALPSERWIVLGSLSLTAHWMLSTL